MILRSSYNHDSGSFSRRVMTYISREPREVASHTAAAVFRRRYWETPAKLQSMAGIFSSTRMRRHWLRTPMAVCNMPLSAYDKKPCSSYSYWRTRGCRTYTLFRRTRPMELFGWSRAP